VQLAASQLGSLGGQQAWHDVRVDAPVSGKPAGNWHLSMLLREWTPIGFVTRDYANFALPVSWPDTAAAAPEAPAEAPAEVSAEAKPAAKPGKAGKAASKSKDKPSKAKPAAVSINTASSAELAAVKGLSKTVATAIVAARPFASLDELLKVKGLGNKLLDKLKGSLTL
jgi:competence ComEA-like helix-hairpin-helix protein